MAVAPTDNGAQTDNTLPSVATSVSVATEGNGSVRNPTLKGGHDPREMARRSHVARRRNREQRAEKFEARLQRLDHKLLNVLEEQLEHSDPAVRQRAAMYLLDRVYGRPMQRQETDGTLTLDVAANADETRAYLAAKLGNVDSRDNGGG